MNCYVRKLLRASRNFLSASNPASNLPFQFLVSRSQVFGNRARLPDGGHEIYVADPARQNVHVEVFGDARAGGFAEVHSEVDGVWLVNVANRGLAAFG